MAGRFKFVAIGVVAFGLLLGVAFGLGVKYGKGKAPSSSGGLTAQQVLSLVGGTGAGGAAAGGTGAAGANGAGGAASALAGLTSGKITAVQGQTLTVETRPGTTVKVNLGATTTVNKNQTGSPQDLKEGSSILVQGARAADGTVTATSVSMLPPELATVFASLGGGATGGGSAASPTTGAPPAAATPGR